MKLRKVKDHLGLARDMQTGAIININKDYNSSLNQYRIYFSEYDRVDGTNTKIRQ